MDSEQGFTLIEVIVTMVIVTMATLMVVTFLRGTVTRSGESIDRVKELAAARIPLEEITAEYYDLMIADGTDWDSFTTYLGNKDDQEGIEVTYFVPENNSVDFEIKEVTITRGRHSVSALFSSF